MHSPQVRTICDGRYSCTQYILVAEHLQHQSWEAGVGFEPEGWCCGAPGANNLPDPLDSRVVKKELGPSYVAVLRFGGFPLDFEVTAAEKRLREALLRDGLEPKAGYR